ncbi:hypothetical protein [Herbihabitans rhizosphaerae]|nr:hypothetical protein [Herbihabitans rhizosphaerae]
MTVVLLGREPKVVKSVGSELRARGFSVVECTGDDEAVAAVDSGDATAIVIGGGVEPASRERVTSAARAHGVAVVAGRRGDGPLATYVDEVLVPELREVSAA